MDHQQPTKKKIRRKPNYQRIIPLFLGVCILLVLIFAGIRLFQWNRGREYIVDPDIDVESEPEDLVYFVDPSLFTDNNDDGRLTILMLGNDTLAYDEDGANIAELIAEKTGATVYNGAFKGSYLAASMPSRPNAEVNPLDAFSFFWVSDSIMSKDWAEQRQALDALPDEYDKEAYKSTLDILESIDYDTVDLLLIYYDGHDYLNANPIANPEDIYDVTTMEGSFTGSFERYPYNYPNMQYILISPTFCYVTDENGQKSGCDLADLGHGNLPTCLTTLQIQAQNYSVSYIDNFYGIKINADTADQYLLEDGITPNKEGRTQIAERISEMINARMTNK